ncbi:FAD dependent oxidoreductase [Microdochium trichocladiopsis]|uniref:FAD dependent oxidoreductase n=1 Tax=Microdochium trichocladiopsis TaxID=1682393 RepID=A0A9P8Y4Q6_9PEZI|nr:FAD dependent oxidoreductase [Microdochium trichocladiopsis]KAH7029537.1 FAD dependent oxidoreductase [Microdochium trichocladiopsis]
MACKNTTQESVLILGAGCFGLATAHQLANAGYTDITVLDKDDVVPSRFSAANDLNKVIRAEYPDLLYTDLSLKAIKKWQTDPLYTPHYHETGFLNVTSSAATQQTKNVVETYISSIQANPAFDGKVQRVSGEDQIHSLVPAFNGPIPGWSGYFNRLAGYAHSANALRDVYRDCVRLGVKFHLGPKDGEVKSLLFAAARGVNICVGAKSRGGTLYQAQKTIVALGGNVCNLIPSLGPQVTGRCWGVAHIQLSPEEAATLRGIPVTNVRDLAFFFEPDQATNKLKFCHMGGGFTNYAWSQDGLSVPYPTLSESKLLPAGDEMQIRKLLRDVFPQFANRPLIDCHLCWFADTADSDYIIDYVPNTDNSLVVLSGDSGHGFKMLPIFGDFVQTLLEIGRQAEPKWQWKGSKSKVGSAWRAGAGQELVAIVPAKL